MRQADFADEADQFQRCPIAALDIGNHLRNTTDTRAAVLTTTQANMWTAKPPMG
jgi:hypothetical protein